MKEEVGGAYKCWQTSQSQRRQAQLAVTADLRSDVGDLKNFEGKIFIGEMHKLLQPAHLTLEDNLCGSMTFDPYFHWMYKSLIFCKMTVKL